MNYSEVKELLNAGFTAEEIRGFMNNPQNSQSYPQEVNSEHSDQVPENSSETDRPAPVPAAENGPSAQPETDKNPNIPNFEHLSGAIEKLIKTIQVSNLQRNTMDNIPSEKDINSQVDSIMASIIRPEHKKGE